MNDDTIEMLVKDLFDTAWNPDNAVEIRLAAIQSLATYVPHRGAVVYLSHIMRFSSNPKLKLASAEALRQRKISDVI